MLRFASRISPAAENSRSTAVEVAGAVKYLDRYFICKYLKVYMSHLLANATRALPAGPLATSEGSIFCHQAKHSTSCSSESRTLSTTPKIQKHGTELSTICQIHLQSRFFSPGLGREPRVTFGCLHSGTKQVATNPTMLKYFQ